MRNLKKLLATVSAAAVVATQAMTAVVYGATGLNDPEFDKALAWMNENGLTKYNTVDSYRPFDSLTREQAAKFYSEFAKKVLGKTADTTKDCTFTDIDQADATLKDSIIESCQLGLFKGSNGKFMPKSILTKAQALAVLVRAVDGMKDETVEPWYKNYFEKAKELGLTRETNIAALEKNVNRYEAALLISRSAETSEDGDLGGLLDGLLGGDTGTGSTTTGTGTDTTTTTGSTDTTTPTVTLAGDLDVSLNPATPAAQSVPQAGIVTFGKFDVKAASSDISINSIKLTRDGLGNRSDISRVWVEKNGMRVSGRQTVGSDNTVYVTFSPAFVVKAGSTETLDLVVSLSGSTNAQHKFVINSATDIASTAAKVGGTYPMNTNLMTTTSYTVVSVAYATAGSSSTYRVGDTGVELGQFKLTNNATDDKSVAFKSIMFRNEGNGDLENLKNLAIYRNGQKITTEVKIDGKNVTFALDDTIAFGRTETYYVKGDINSVVNTAGDSYQFSLRYSDDMSIVETATLFKSTITGTFTSYMSTYNVSGGDVVMSKSTSVSSDQTVAPGANDVVLMAADLKVAQSITLQDLAVTFNTTGLSGAAGDMAKDFSSLKLVVGNQTVATFTPSTSTANTFTFEGSTTISANTVIKITANVRTNAAGKWQLNSITPASFGIREYASNGNSIQASQLVGSCNGIVTTVGSATLTFTRNDGIANQNLTVGSSNVTMVQFDVKANDVSDVTITKLKFGTGA